MKEELWKRLADHNFENVVPPSLRDRVAQLFLGENTSMKAFAAKVARKHGWPTSFALRAVEEYKKYVYLGVVSKYLVSPPAVIDAVWHEHLLFTGPYRLFCHDVLKQNFDHSPELLPNADQTGYFTAQYLKLLDFYRYEFNSEPPEDIWGKPKFGSNTGTPHKPHRKPDFDNSVYASDVEKPLHTLVPDDDLHILTSAVYSGHGSDSGTSHHHDHSAAHTQSHVPAEAFDGHGSVDTGGADTGGGDAGGGGGCSSGCSSSCGGGCSS